MGEKKYSFEQGKQKNMSENCRQNQVKEALGEVSYVCVVLITGAHISSSCRRQKYLSLIC